MTEINEREVLAQAIELVDKGLGVLQTRNMVPTAEVADLLLDLRLLLISAEVEPEPVSLG